MNHSEYMTGQRPRELDTVRHYMDDDTGVVVDSAPARSGQALLIDFENAGRMRCFADELNLDVRG